jgi:hypothetical protein
VAGQRMVESVTEGSERALGRYADRTKAWPRREYAWELLPATGRLHLRDVTKRNC